MATIFQEETMRLTVLFTSLLVSLLVLVGATVVNPWLINRTVQMVQLSPWEWAIIAVSLITPLCSERWRKVVRDKPVTLPSQNTLKGLARAVSIVSGLSLFINGLQDSIVWSALFSFVAGVNACTSVDSCAYPKHNETGGNKTRPSNTQID